MRRVAVTAPRSGGVSDRPPGRWRSDRGAASLWLLAVGLLLAAAGLFAAAVGAATVARHRAQAAADLGALAGARWALWGDEVSCAAAAEIVVANGGALVSCRLDGVDVIVVAEMVMATLPGMRGSARAVARAGPVRVEPWSAGGRALFDVRSAAGRAPERPGVALVTRCAAPEPDGIVQLTAGPNCS